MIIFRQRFCNAATFCTQAPLSRNWVKPETYTKEKYDELFLIKSAKYEFVMNYEPKFSELYEH